MADPQIFSVDATAVNQHSGNNSQYEAVLIEIFTECHRIIKNDNGRLIFTFHHWNPKGWAELTVALKKARFFLINRHVIHSENQSSVHFSNQNASVHHVISVFGKKSKERIKSGSRLTRQEKMTVTGFVKNAACCQVTH